MSTPSLPDGLIRFMSKPALDDPRSGEIIRRTIPMGRAGTPEEIAAPVLFLCTPYASFITGGYLQREWRGCAGWLTLLGIPAGVDSEDYFCIQECAGVFGTAQAGEGVSLHTKAATNSYSGLRLLVLHETFASHNCVSMCCPWARWGQTSAAARRALSFCTNQRQALPQAHPQPKGPWETIRKMPIKAHAVLEEAIKALGGQAYLDSRHAGQGHYLFTMGGPTRQRRFLLALRGASR